MNNQTENTSLPWYRYGMVWMVILLPLIVVVASIITMAIAIKHAPIIVDKEIIENTEHEKINLTPDRDEIVRAKD